MLSEGIPIGFGLGLAMHENAMKNYSGMNDEEQGKVLEQARQAQSKKDMEILINQIGKMNQPLG